MKIIRKFEIREYKNPVTSVRFYEICYRNIFNKLKPIIKDNLTWRVVSLHEANKIINFLNTI